MYDYFYLRRFFSINWRKFLRNDLNGITFLFWASDFVNIVYIFIKYENTRNQNDRKNNDANAEKISK